MENNLLFTPDHAVWQILYSVPKFQIKMATDNSGRTVSESDTDQIDDDLKQFINQYNIQRKEELEARCGEMGDGLSDLFILTGKIDTLQSVICQLKSTSLKEDMDFEFLEIDSKTLTREYVDKLREPNGKDGGFIVIKDFSSFSSIPDINTQIYILSKIMRNPFGLKCTGWHIVFLENTDEKDKWWPNSCVHYFQQKSFLKCWYVE